MEAKLKKHKSFGEILDLTFSLCKQRFKDFFLLFLILIGPIYLLQAIIRLILGDSFFRVPGSGDGWYQQISSIFSKSQTIAPENISSNLSVAGVGFISSLVFPVAIGSVLIAIDHIQKNEQYTVGSVIKQAFSRYWPMLGSTILFGLISFGMMLLPTILFSLTFAFVMMANQVIGIILAIIVGIAVVIGIGYLLTRWSFFFGSVVLDKDTPGFVRSWNLTRKRAWSMMGLYLVMYLIISGITMAVDLSLGLLLGDSLLYSILGNILTLITTMFLSVGYGVMFFDLKMRHDSEDLKELINDYNRPPNL